VRSGRRFRQDGLTLFGLLVALVVVSILAAYAAMRINSSAENTLAFQAQRMASDIRHMKTLGTTWGKALSFVTVAGTNGTYEVRCTTSTVSPCPAATTIAVTDPVTGTSFSHALEKNVSLSSSVTTLKFDSQGRPLTSGGAIATAATTYTLTGGPATVTVTVRPITGLVVVSP